MGIGGDGHLLSVFPGSDALTSDRLALAIPAPTHIEPHVERVTLNPAILAPAGRILAMVAGAAKAEIVARILEGPRDPGTLPARPRPAGQCDVAPRRGRRPLARPPTPILRRRGRRRRSGGRAARHRLT